MGWDCHLSNNEKCRQSVQKSWQREREKIEKMKNITGQTAEEETPKGTKREHPETRSQGKRGFQRRIESNAVK